MDKNYIGDVGVVIEVDCVSDITGDATHLLRVKKPDGTIVNWTASIVLGHYLQYITTAGDFDQVGRYKCQAVLDGPILGETFEIMVYDVFK